MLGNRTGKNLQGGEAGPQQGKAAFFILLVLYFSGNADSAKGGKVRKRDETHRRILGLLGATTRTEITSLLVERTLVSFL